MKTINKKSVAVRGITGVLLLLSCFWMYDFYKCLSGFIANGFREPLVMLPMILAYFLPVFCFLFFFYDVYVKAIHPVVKTAYSVLVVVYAVADLVLILNQVGLYASNHALGVYDALPSILLHFPYDMILLLSVIALWQIFRLVAADRRGTKLHGLLEGLKQQGTLHLCVVEYVLLCVMAIVVFVFTGAAVYATFSAFANAFYDVRYIFLLIWVMLVPMANLAVLTLRPEKMKLRKRTKTLVLSSLILANVLFAWLFLILEKTYPDFLVHIGKPVFLIAFSVSLPIEPCVIFGIMALGTLTAALRLILAAKNRYARWEN